MPKPGGSPPTTRFLLQLEHAQPHDWIAAMVAALMTKGQQWKLCLTNGQEDLHLWTSPGLTNEEIAASFGAPSGGRPTEG